MGFIVIVEGVLGYVCEFICYFFDVLGNLNELCLCGIFIDVMLLVGG